MRQLRIVGGVLLVGMLAGCVSQGDIQAVRADLLAVERQRRQRNSEVDRRLEAIEMPGQNPRDMRRDMAQTHASTEELRVELQRLNGRIQELQHQQQQGGSRGLTATAQDIFATKLAELETRVATIEYRLDSPGSTPSAATTRRPSARKSPVSSATARRSTQPPLPKEAATTTPRPPSTSRTSPGDNTDNLYKQALSEYQDGKADVAIPLFKQFLRQNSDHPLAGNAQYWIGESLYKQKQYEAAIVAYDEVVQKYPKDTKVPAALLKQGFAFAELKDARNARFFLQKVRKDFPGSPEAKQAEEKLQHLGR